MKLGVLRAGEFRFGSTLQTKKYQPRRVGMCGIGGAGGNSTSSESLINTGSTNLKSRRIAYVSLFVAVSRLLFEW